MILRKDLPAVVARAFATERALDAGGWFQLLNAATHVLDLRPMETRLPALDRARCASPCSPYLLLTLAYPGAKFVARSAHVIARRTLGSGNWKEYR